MEQAGRLQEYSWRAITKTRQWAIGNGHGDYYGAEAEKLGAMEGLVTFSRVERETWAQRNVVKPVRRSCG